ncbi:unnamed protein product [Medioppia subpectinata]|uniref:Uncharacterized protein n=1 Tax=Medioppia subpectinata TaxID=1979941 RepID=A0A7R9QMX9_9ACAR|nr:unnamed protein product [Medioppia subpectinata]CAG2123580.1 unnamed protein product [Medioppia subpectinata]
MALTSRGPLISRLWI